MSKSTDLGKTWADIENVTNTPGGIFPNKQLETSVHLPNVAMDDMVAVFYQMPDLYTETYPPAAGYEDYMNRVYVAMYSNDSEGGTVALDENTITPKGFSLEQNYPNPFNPVTNISYEIQHQSDISLDLYDLRGMKVKSLVSGKMPAGSHSFTFDASDMASGVYFYTLSLDNITQTRKLVLMK
jgi:hypothetical protein